MFTIFCIIFHFLFHFSFRYIIYKINLCIKRICILFLFFCVVKCQIVSLKNKAIKKIYKIQLIANLSRFGCLLSVFIYLAPFTCYYKFKKIYLFLYDFYNFFFWFFSFNYLKCTINIEWLNTTAYAAERIISSYIHNFSSVSYAITFNYKDYLFIV